MAGISVGTQLVAPEGFRELEKGITYYFLRSSSKNNRVLLVHFAVREQRQVKHKSVNRPSKRVTPTPLPVLTAMDRDQFEGAVLGRKITHAEVQQPMPPWLLGLENKSLHHLDAGRNNYVKSHANRVEEKVEYIFPLVMRFDEILDADDPERLLNIHARSCLPQQNETRLRLWFFLYLLFGRSRNALRYPVHRIGKWVRDATTAKCRWGRPHKHLGKEHGHNTTPAMKKLIFRGWRREAKLGQRMSQIYAKVMAKDFGCRSREVVEGKQKRRCLWHPNGDPFPALGAFVYHLLQEFGTEEIQLALYGYVRVRRKLQPSKGPFTEHVWNLMQVTERDAYAVGDLARGLIEGHPLPPLYVVRKRDTASGILTGIGFSQGGERASAYRMAQFCEAIPKAKFFSLFGLELAPWRWPCQGNSPRDIQDRGAGCTEDAFSRVVYYQPVVKESPPSHAGQSKAVIESVNPKSMSDEEGSSFFASELRTFELVRRELLRLIGDNDSILVRSRVAPDLADRVARATPLAVWDLLDELGRNDSVQMTFADAVRAYLTKVAAKLTSEGVILNGMKYGSDALDAVGGRRMVSGKQTVDVEIYVLDACVRHCWIDLKGQLIELDLKVDIPVADAVLCMSLEEQKQFQEFVRRQDSFHPEHRTAVTLEIYEAFKRQTGLDWEAGTRVAGQAKRKGAAAKQEAQESKNAVHARRVA